MGSVAWHFAKIGKPRSSRFPGLAKCFVQAHTPRFCPSTPGTLFISSFDFSGPHVFPRKLEIRKFQDSRPMFLKTYELQFFRFPQMIPDDPG
jgi:hypothetical protein